MNEIPRPPDQPKPPDTMPPGASPGADVAVKGQTDRTDAGPAAGPHRPGSGTDTARFREAYLASQKAGGAADHTATGSDHASSADAALGARTEHLGANTEIDRSRQASLASQKDAGKQPGAADPNPQLVKFQQALIDSGLRAWVQDPTPFEKSIAGNRAYQDVLDPKSGQVLGYRHPYTSTGVDHLEIVDRNGKVAWWGTTGERGVQADAVSPVDILTGVNPAALGAAAERALATSAGKALADATGSTLTGITGKAAAGDAAKAAAGDAVRVLAGDAAKVAAGDASKASSGDAARILAGDVSKIGTRDASKVAAGDASKTSTGDAARAADISDAQLGGRKLAGAGSGGADGPLSKPTPASPGLARRTKV